MFQSYLEQMGDFEMQMMPPHMSGSHPKMPNGAAPYDINPKLTAEQRRQKNKRRSKNDQEGRTHKCSLCDKTYLSYPALYTHLKTKHADAKGQDGQPLTPLQSGRGRGRPKKIVSFIVIYGRYFVTIDNFLLLNKVILFSQLKIL